MQKSSDDACVSSLQALSKVLRARARGGLRLVCSRAPVTSLLCCCPGFSLAAERVWIALMSAPLFVMVAVCS
ncbi:hypothetical protein CSUI_005776 [Cystoisospora suis]|uniref:Uncharacterized protein n=1 Tax=Cystoisospora suis TaxID=483139 RepID=A0A2C6KVW3_9APIC|nr:hypothetical protein CSUI_005776 [Cystoisospora suis]